MLQVCTCVYWQSEQGLVEGSGKESVQQILMDQSQAQNATTETEPGDTQTQHLLQNHTNPGGPLV